MVRNCFCTLGIALVTALTASAAQSDEVAVSLTRVGARGTMQRFELRNEGTIPFGYAHMFGQGASPVAYCRSTEGSIRICTKKIFLNFDGSPWEEGTELAPGKSIRFDAYPQSGETIGVKSWVNATVQFTWATVKP